MNHYLRALLGCAVVVVLSWSQYSDACGCFAPPNVAETIVQAGERILFSVKDGKVTAHIQIQYSGEAKDFGWLLPLPSVPTLKTGSDELFTVLDATTRPSYVLTRGLGDKCQRSSSPFLLGCAARAVSAPFSSGEESPPPTPLVVRSSVGPYEYAVLRADDKSEMLRWLNDNHFFIPAGTENAVDPYIHTGAYFLALKLKAGARTGDVTPVILEYASELPMIPLILTSVGATPNMGIQVFLLGNGRGIPRNFHHVVLNDALLNWNDASNYSQLVTRAVAEAPNKHAFVTEYAGPSDVMRGQLAPAERFGNESTLAANQTPDAFVQGLVVNGFASRDRDSNALLPAPVIRILLSDIPYPPALAAKGVDENGFLTHLDYYLGQYRTEHPEDFTGWMLDFDAPSLARQIFAEYVEPMRATDALFTEFSTLTRLYTTLSPEDMTEDPVFSFNASLPNVSATHNGTMVNECPGQTLNSEQGWKVDDGVASSLDAAPAALRVEVLAEEGAPTVVTDNREAIHGVFKTVRDPVGGCSTVDPMTLGFAGALILMRMRSKRRAARS
jgi:hypothetical protein